MNNIPNYMPVLSAGAHKNPSEGACVMEYVSLLAGESWSDTPSCTHPALARAAQVLNDKISDNDRYLLVPLIGRLFGTDNQSKEISVGLARWFAADAATNAAFMVNFLSKAIDEYDRLSGRTNHRAMSQSDLAALKDLVG